MTPEDLRAAISASGLPVDRFAEAVGRSARGIRYCVRGEKPITQTLEIAVRAILHQRIQKTGDDGGCGPPPSAMTPEELRAAIGASGLPINQFAKAVGRTARSLDYCLRGKRPITRTLEIAVQQVLYKRTRRGARQRR